jgi:hypothetical protein
MSVEIYYAPRKEAELVTFAEAQQRFITAGLPCTVEPETEDMHWLVFEPRETTILASTKGEHLVFATVHASFHEEPRFIEQLDAVLQNMGFSADESEESATEAD